MPLGTELGLGPGDFVLNGDPTPPDKKGTASYPIFGPCLLWPNGWMDEDATWYGSRHCVRRRPSSAPSASFGPPESTTQTANRSVQPFCTAHGRKTLYFTMGALSRKIAPTHGDLDPPSNT